MDSYDTFRFILHLFLVILIVLGSLLILLVIYITRQYQTPSGLLIGNLALTDLLVGAFLLPFGIPAIYSEGWPSGRKLCILNGFTNQCLSSVAIVTLAAISLDRYMAIIHAIRYHQIMTLRRVRIIIVILWAFGLVLAIFPLLGWGRYIYEHGASLCVTDFKTNTSFTFFIFSVVFGIPLNVIIAIYFRIFMAVRKQSKAIRSTRIHPVNQSPAILINENRVQLTIPRASPGVKPTSQSGDQLANENVVQLTNQRTDKWNNQNTVHLTNQSTIQSANETTNDQTNHTRNVQANEKTDHPNNRNNPFPVHTVIQTNQTERRTTNQNREKTTKTTLPKNKSLRRTLKKESKAALTMFAIIGVFVFCITPFAIYSLYSLYTGKSYELAYFITSKAAYSNAIFNPLIYGVMNKLFRKGFYQVFHILFRCKKRPINLDSFSTKPRSSSAN